MLHHNLKYTWLDPKDDDVVKDYEALYGPDNSSDEDVTEDEGQDEAEGEADAP